MCFGGGRQGPQQPAQVTLPPAPQIVNTATAPLQGAPAPSRRTDMTSYKKRGKRALTIPMTSSVNVPGMGG